MPAMNVSNDSMISSGEAAALLGVTDRTIRRWLRDGVLPGYRFGRNFRIASTEIEAFKARGRDAARAA